MKIRFAVTPPGLAFHENVFPDYISACEQLGFDTLWLSDVPLGPLGDPLFSLAFAAGHTRRLKLGANVVPLGRNPWLLARQLAQLDRMSGGRLLLSFVPGLGQPAERAVLGHPTGDRWQAVSEILALARRWWAGETITASHGPYHFDALALQLLPIQRPLEVWLGGIGPAALERVARTADGWLTAAATPAEAARGRMTISARASRTRANHRPRAFRHQHSVCPDRTTGSRGRSGATTACRPRSHADSPGWPSSAPTPCSRHISKGVSANSCCVPSAIRRIGAQISIGWRTLCCRCRPERRRFRSRAREHWSERSMQ